MQDIKYYLQKTAEEFKQKYSVACTVTLKKIFRERKSICIDLKIGKYEHKYKLILKNPKQKSSYLKMPSFNVSIEYSNVDLIIDNVQHKMFKEYFLLLEKYDEKIKALYLDIATKAKRNLYVDVGTLKIIMKCNVKCPFCAEKKYLKNSKKETTKKTVFRMIDVLEKISKNLCFTGGEPTISPFLIDAIKHAKGKKFKSVSLVTNGARLADKKYLEELVAAGLDQLSFSWLTNEDDVATRTFGKNIWPQQKQALENIKAIRKRIKLNFYASFSNLNQDSLLKLLPEYSEYKPDQIMMIYCNDWDYLADLEKNDLVGKIEAVRKRYLKKIKVRYMLFPFCKVPRIHWTNLQNYINPSADPGNPKDWAVKERVYYNAGHAKICNSCLCKNACSFPSKAYMKKYGDHAELKPVRDMGNIRIAGC